MSLLPSNPIFSSPSDLPDSSDELLSRLKSESERSQLQLIQDMLTLESRGWMALINFLVERKAQAPTPIDGKIFQALMQVDAPDIKPMLQSHFPHGLVPLQSAKGIDYSRLQTLLVEQDYQAADRVTLEKLCELAGPAAVQRKWLYFTEVDNFPSVDLHTINRLWLVFSEGKFGFSVQRDLWVNLGKNWERLWPQIGWKTGPTWTRYPQEFTWDLSAPKGHLPLSNQLRGVRTMASLLSHPAWTEGSGNS